MLMIRVRMGMGMVIVTVRIIIPRAKAFTHLLDSFRLDLFRHVWESLDTF